MQLRLTGVRGGVGLDALADGSFVVHNTKPTTHNLVSFRDALRLDSFSMEKGVSGYFWRGW